MTRSVRWHTMAVAAAVILAAGLAFHGLSNHIFWDDEANTGVFARNLLRYGELTGWDGRNLIGYRAGAELDENLKNVYMPPLQYYVAAAGLAVFGETTFGGRVLFLIVGLLALVAVGSFSLRFFDTGFPWSVPVLLLAVAPSYLLYIRNCRYYSLGVLFTMILLAVWAGDLRPRRSLVAACAVAVVSTVALWFTHYLNAASILVALPLFFFLPRYRDRGHVALLAVAYAASVVAGIYILLTANPFAAKVAFSDPSSKLERVITLLAWHTTGLGIFEFIPVLLMLVFAIPYQTERYAHLKPQALKGLILMGAVAASCVVTAVLSPQPLHMSNVADMRHQVPLIAIGACLSGLALHILWQMSRPAAVLAAALTVFSNIPHLGFMGKPSGLLEPRSVACTLCDYVRENAHDYSTSHEILVSYLEKLPEDSTVFIYPTYMAYSPMFYAPDLRYACQLTEDKKIRPDIKSRLPDYLFWERAHRGLDFALISTTPPSTPTGPLNLTYRGARYYLGQFRLIDHIDVFTEDRSRPEIPWHSFSPDEFSGVLHRGFFVSKMSP